MLVVILIAHLIILEVAPKEIGRNFDCSFNKLTSLKGGPKKVGSINCNDNDLTTLEGPEKINFSIDCSNNPNLSLLEIIKFILKCDIGKLNNTYKNYIESDYDDSMLDNIIKNKNDYKSIIKIIFGAK
jgi:hypothetical protein